MTFATGVAVFAVVLLGVAALELLARRGRRGHATMADMGRWLRGHPLMRWALLGSWAFTGWHFFVR